MNRPPLRGGFTLEDKLIDPAKIAVVEKAERRLGEVAYMTSAKAPEFLATMNEACAFAQELKKDAAHRESNQETANKALRAQIMLERVPEILREKGLASSKNPLGSAELRESVIDMDVGYIEAQNRLAEVIDEKTMWSIREQALGRAFSAVKAIVGERQYSRPQNNGNNDNESSYDQWRHATARKPTSHNEDCGFGDPR